MLPAFTQLRHPQVPTINLRRRLDISIYGYLRVQQAVERVPLENIWLGL